MLWFGVLGTIGHFWVRSAGICWGGLNLVCFYWWVLVSGCSSGCWVCRLYCTVYCIVGDFGCDHKKMKPKLVVILPWS